MSAPTKKSAAGPEVFVVPHFHFDAEWLTTYEQYLKRSPALLRERLRLLRADPEHRFCPPEELATLPFLAQCDQRYRRLFRDAVKNGGVELKGAISSGELTLNQGESIARQFTLGRYFIERALGFVPELVVAQNIDNYALCPQLPQILAQCGRQFLIVGVYAGERTATVHVSEPPTDRIDFWWRGPDGTSVLTLLSMPGYGGILACPQKEPSAAIIRALIPCSSRRAIMVFSGGDMAGADPQLSAKLRQWSSQHGFPPLRIGLPREYFQHVRSDPTLPTVAADSITDHLGTFESHVDVRLLNRKVESLLLCAEKFATAAYALGAKYPQAKLDRAWFELLVNHHHDPSLACLHDALIRHVVRRYRTVDKLAASILKTSLASIARRADTRAAEGEPIIVFNPLGWTRSDVVEVEIDGLSAPRALKVTDSHDNACPMHVSRKGRKLTLQFVATAIPSLGYKVFYLREDDGRAEGLEPFSFQLKFGPKDLLQVTTRRDVPYDVGELEIVRDDGCANVERLRPRSEQRIFPEGWHEQRYLGTLGISVRLHYRFRRSTVVQEFRVLRGLDRIDVRCTVDWRDKGYRLRARFPAGASNPLFYCHEPFMVNRRRLESPTVRKPALFWAAAVDPGVADGLAIANRGTSNYAVSGDALFMTVLRSTDARRLKRDPVEPSRDAGCYWCMLDHANDLPAEIGQHVIEYSILPFARSIESGRVHRRAYEFNYPLVAIRTERHAGRLPGNFSFVKVDDDQLIVSAWKKAYRCANTVLRLYEPHGRGRMGITVEAAIGKVTGDCDMDERTRHTRPRPVRRVKLDIGAYKIRSLIVTV